MYSDGEQEEGGSTQDGEERGVSGNIFEESQQDLLMSRNGGEEEHGESKDDAEGFYRRQYRV